jgi:hypothetical protein
MNPKVVEAIGLEKNNFYHGKRIMRSRNVENMLFVIVSQISGIHERRTKASA